MSTNPTHSHEGQATTPTSKSSKTDDRRSRTLLNILPKLPSSDSLSNSPGPASPGKNLLSIVPFYSSVALAGVSSYIDKPDLNTDRVSQISTFSPP